MATSLSAHVRSLHRQHGRKRKSQQRTFWIESLESRTLMAADIGISPPTPNDYHFEEPLRDSLSGGLVAPTAPLNQTFFLNSRPSATKTIYLDFNGHTISGTLWNSQFNNNQPFTLTAYDIDGVANSFSDTELQRIQDIYLQVAEDFSPFDVNVTTQEPPVADLINSGGGDTRWGIRTVIGSTFAPFANAGGVAYLTSFNWNSDTPALVFENNLSNGAVKPVAEATSHEVGHTLGLNHDGRTTPVEEYYQGHGSGLTGWAPIMGVGYSRQLVQWSQGEYAAASNTEDDLTIITTNNGFGYRLDDFTNIRQAAQPIAGTGVTTFTVSQSGVIERRTDVDFFRIDSGNGVINLSINGAPISPNLDIQADLLDSNGTVVATSNPAAALNATINFTATTGTYYLRIDGVGLPGAASPGYSDYGSIGQFRITGTYRTQVTNQPPVINDQRLANLPENAAVGTVVGTVSASDPDAGQTLTYSILSGNTGGAFAINSSTGQIIVANASAIDFETNPQFSLNVQVTDSFSPSLSDTGLVEIRLENLFEVTPSAVQLLVPLYEYPLSAPGVLSPWWQRVRDDATPTTPMTVVINPDNGPLNPALGGPDYANYLFALNRLRENPNIRILGYIPTGFGSLPAATVLGDLAWYANGYKHNTNGGSLIDGVFLDEMSNNPTHLPIYNAIATGIRSNVDIASRYIAANPGTTIPVQYLDANAADLFVVREGDLNDFNSNPLPPYVTSPAYDHLEFGAILHSTPDFNSALQQLKLQGLDFGFVTDDVLPNPFNQIPTYWTAQLNRLHAPAVGSGTFSLPENSPVGTVVGVVNAVEPDGQPLTFSILSGNEAGIFAIDSATGSISVANAAALNFELTNTFPLVVQATDNETPSQSDSNSIVIQLTNVAESTFTFAAGVLTVVGTSDNDALSVFDDAGTVKIWEQGIIIDTTLPSASVTSISLFGGNGHDWLSLAGNPRIGSIFGEDGNDILLSGLGNDTLTGGNGIDTVSYQNATIGVVANLALTTVQNTVGAGSDRFVTIENLRGSEQNDTLTGSTAANVIEGLGGNDVLNGGSGNDIFLFNASIPFGADTVSDASGIDTISFQDSNVGVVFQLGLTTPQAIGTSSIQLSTATAFENLVGGSANDTLTGGTGANLLVGGPGDDSLQGLGGNDTYEFDADSPLGSDTIFDGIGVDTVSFAPTSSDVVFDLSSTAAQVVNGFLTLQLDSATAVDNLTGGAGADQLTGNAGVNILIGGPGNDSIQGLAGNDTYSFDSDSALGQDTLQDTAGIDILNFSLTTTRSINLSLDVITPQTVNSNLGLILGSATAFESIVGGSLNDQLTGNSLANSLTGGPGNDVLSGLGGVDTLIGLAGNDTLEGGPGNDIYSFDADLALGSDTINDLSGIDQLTFATTTLQTIAIDLSSALPQAINANLTLLLTSGLQIENVIGGSLNDLIVGNTLANNLNGGPGDDLIQGGDLNDLLIGGAGNDNLQGGDGNDQFQFDADLALGTDTVDDISGVDTLDFTLTTTTGITVDLNNTSLQVVNPNLSLVLVSNTSLDSVLGTRLDDTLFGNGQANVLSGGLGNDTIDGRDGRDLLIGGAGLDSLIGGLDDDLLIAGTSTHEASLNNLNIILGEWTSANSYATRVANLRSGVSGVALIAKTTVKKDTGADQLQGNANEDWFFSAVEDAILDLQAGELIDAL